MILIGQYDSPFVRRVGIALHLYQLPFEHRPWSAFADADKLRSFNPLLRVPTLVLDDGFVLIESHLMLDYLDRRVGPERALIPAQDPARRQAQYTTALATGMAEKAVSLFYERILHKTEPSPQWQARCGAQIGAVLAVLEPELANRSSRYCYGATLGHADIAIGCALRFIADAHPGLCDAARYPALTAFANALEDLPVFRKVSQPFLPPS